MRRRASSPGATTTAPRSCACRSTSRTRARARASSTARSTRRPTRTSPTRCCSRPGLKGIENGYELPAEAEDNVWELSDAERRALGYTQLPASLDHALSLMEDSELVAETLGEQVFNYVLLNKRREWREYRAQVTPYELESNLEIL